MATNNSQIDASSQFIAAWSNLAEVLGEIGLMVGIPLPPRVIIVADKLLADGHIDGAARDAIVAMWDVRNLYIHGGYDPGETQMVANTGTANELINRITPLRDALLHPSGA